MKYLLKLSQLNFKLSELEVDSLFEIFNKKYTKSKDNKFLIVNTELKNIKEFCERSSLIKLSAEIIKITKSKNLEKIFKEISWDIKSPYKVRIKDKTKKMNSQKLEKELSSIIWNSLENPSVDLKNPKTSIYVFITNKKTYITKLIWKAKTNRFKDTEPKNKPGFHPTILRPWLARVLINLSRAKDNLLDPFCGTGAVIIEAARMNVKTTGCDLDSRMIDKTKKNLKFYKINSDIKRLDATTLSKHFDKKFNSIVTDPPYKRSSFSSKDDLSELYSLFLKEANKILKKKGYLTLMIPKGTKITVPSTLKIKDKADLYVHGGLTRRILIIQKTA